MAIPKRLIEISLEDLLALPIDVVQKAGAVACVNAMAADVREDPVAFVASRLVALGYGVLEDEVKKRAACPNN